MKTSHLDLSGPKFLTLYIAQLCRSLCQVPLTEEDVSLVRVVWLYWSKGITGVVLLLCSFSKLVIYFPLEFVTYVVSDSTTLVVSGAGSILSIGL